MTQEEVATACGIKRERYQAYESGRRDPKAEMLKRFSNVLDCSVDEILKDPNKEESNE